MNKQIHMKLVQFSSISQQNYYFDERIHRKARSTNDFSLFPTKNEFKHKFCLNLMVSSRNHSKTIKKYCKNSIY